MEERGIIRLQNCGAENDEGVFAAGDVCGEIERKRAANGSLSEARSESAILRLKLGTALSEQGLEMRCGQSAEAMHDGAGTNGGKQLLRVLGEQDERGVLGRLLEKLEQTVGGFFHECGRSEDGESALGLGGRAVEGDVNGLANLAELDHQLWRVGRNDEHIRMRLDEDARLALVGLTQVVAGCDGFIDQGF